MMDFMGVNDSDGPVIPGQRKDKGMLDEGDGRHGGMFPSAVLVCS